MSPFHTKGPTLATTAKFLLAVALLILSAILVTSLVVDTRLVLVGILTGALGYLLSSMENRSGWALHDRVLKMQIAESLNHILVSGEAPVGAAGDTVDAGRYHRLASSVKQYSKYLQGEDR